MFGNKVRAAALGSAALALSLVTAPAFAVTAAPNPTVHAATVVTVHAAKATVAPKKSDVLRVVLKSGTKPLAKAKVTLEKRRKGTKRWTVVASKTTNAKGAVAFTVIPGTKKGHEQYEVVFAGTKAYKASHSKVITVAVS